MNAVGAMDAADWEPRGSQDGHFPETTRKDTRLSNRKLKLVKWKAERGFLDDGDVFENINAVRAMDITNWEPKSFEDGDIRELAHGDGRLSNQQLKVTKWKAERGMLDDGHRGVLNQDESETVETTDAVEALDMVKEKLKDIEDGEILEMPKTSSKKRKRKKQIAKARAKDR